MTFHKHCEYKLNKKNNKNAQSLKGNLTRYESAFNHDTKQTLKHTNTFAVSFPNQK